MNDERIGDLGCPAIDVEQWFQKNQVPLFTGLKNRWVIRHRVRGEARSFPVVHGLALQHLQDWLGEPALDIAVERISSDAIPLETAVTTYRALELPLLTHPDPRSYVWLLVTFRWNSPTSRQPWFVRNEKGVLSFPAAKRCPVDPDWFLDSVGQAEATEPASMDSPTGDKPPPVRYDVFPQGPSLLESSGRVLASVAVGLAAGWLYLKLRPDPSQPQRGGQRGR